MLKARAFHGSGPIHVHDAVIGNLSNKDDKGLAKLGNIVAETMFLVMFPWVAKLGNICFGHKI